MTNPNSSLSPSKPASRAPPPSSLLTPQRPSPSSSSRPTSPLPSRPSSPLPRSPSSPRPPASPPPLHLSVRFSSASVPDLQLDIPHPQRTTVAALKHLIRSRLAPASADRRLRFIHGGKILPDGAVLSSVLRAPPPPPRDGDDNKKKGKGKNVEGRPDAAATRVYVNCSIGDVLSADELAAEAAAATTPSPSPAPAAAPTKPAPGGGERGAGERQQQQPRGFARLLAAGLTPAEVNQLRLQFRSIQAARHTPDTMPSPDTLRGMEDAWIDNSNSASSGAAGGGRGGTGEGDGEGPVDDGAFGMAGMLDVLVKGMVVGFMFPLGSIGWLIREEGLWSRRWQVFASFGFILSLTIGMVRAISSDR